MTALSTAEGALLVDRPVDGVLRLRLNRPTCRNAIDGHLVDALLQTFESADDCAAIVLGSADPAAFSSGVDVSLDDASRAAVSDKLYALYELMVATPAPIVVAVAGHAVGGGAQLAVAGDLRIGSPNCRFRFLGAGHGLAVGSWGLPSLVGRGRALELCLTMREVCAEEALSIGLVNCVEGDPDRAAVELAQRFVGLVPEAVARIKRVVALASGGLSALALEREENGHWSGSMERRPR